MTSALRSHRLASLYLAEMGVGPGKAAAPVPVLGKRRYVRPGLEVPFGNGSEQSERMGAAAEIAWASEPTNEVFRHFFDDAPVGLAQCDRQGMVTIVNPCLEEMLGSSVCTNVSLSDLIRAEDRSECDKLVLELKDAKRTSFRIDSRPACADGHSMRWIVWRVNGKNGADAQFFAVAQDFDNRPSEHRRLQVERLETMGRLAGGVAHDFNNLLTGVLLYCDLLLAALDASNRARKYAEEIRKAGLQATSLVRQLLALAKPTRNEPRLLSFNEIAEGMRNLLVRLIGENIDLNVWIQWDSYQDGPDNSRCSSIWF